MQWLGFKEAGRQKADTEIKSSSLNKKSAMIFTRIKFFFSSASVRSTLITHIYSA